MTTSSMFLSLYIGYMSTISTEVWTIGCFVQTFRLLYYKFITMHAANFNRYTIHAFISYEYYIPSTYVCHFLYQGLY